MAARPVSGEDIDRTVEVWNGVGKVHTKAAEILGVSEATIRRRLAEAERRKNRDPAVSAGMDVVGTSIVPSGMWIKTGKGEDGVSRSIYIRPQQETSDDVLARIKAAFEDMEPAAPVAPPERILEELCTVYCLADMHIGQMSWGREVGVSYDTKIAVTRLREWVGRLVAASPASKEAVILDVGDTTHMDDNTNQTPRSKHVLDVDSRYFRTIEESVSALSDAVELTLAKHEKVTLVILEGNHSPHSCIALMFALAERYRLNPRVTVRKEPGGFWAYQFGKNMLAAAHGDKAKPERMVMFMADEHAEIWGATRHRFLWSGHFHSAKMEDIGGVKHERLRAMTSRDAYAYSHAYVARSQLQAITLHAETGELQRSYVGI
jgi:transposase